MRVAILIQARLNSTRLPRKVCKEINGLPILTHIYRRMLACEQADQVVCSLSADDEEILSNLCMKYGMYHCYGDEEDLLHRHRRTATRFFADAIVRVTADCLFHDPALIDELIIHFRENWPYARALSNWPNRKVSEGLDAEVWSLELLEQLHLDSKCPRENFATYAMNKGLVAQLWGNHRKPNGADLHLSIDTQQDFERAEKMLKILGNDEWNYEQTLEAYRKCS
jgi:spore coat polysaccharide biosynthesis protein SpsF (cytidylyltransferase family)